jgi:DNA-binding NarL/FixJ family response regulator
MLNSGTCTILIAGNCVFRRGVSSIVRDIVPNASTAEASCFADASARLKCGQFFAAIFDLDTDKLIGPISFGSLRVDYPNLILGVLSHSASANHILSYLAAGVTGYIVENAGQQELERAVRLIVNGAIYIPPNLIEPAACEPEPERPARCRNDALTPRQHGVLRLLLKGYSNKEIARELHLSPHTVKIHVGALLRRFAVPKRSDLAAAASAFGTEAVGLLAA